jgi:hypothetical protein
VSAEAVVTDLPSDRNTFSGNKTEIASGRQRGQLQILIGPVPFICPPTPGAPPTGGGESGPEPMSIDLEIEIGVSPANGETMDFLTYFKLDGNGVVVYAWYQQEPGTGKFNGVGGGIGPPRW